MWGKKKGDEKRSSVRKKNLPVITIIIVIYVVQFYY